jgi:hypothetical protein
VEHARAIGPMLRRIVEDGEHGGWRCSRAFPAPRNIPRTGLQLQRCCGAGFYRDGHMPPTALEQQAVRGLRDGLQPHAAASTVGDRPARAPRVVAAL